MNEPIDKLSLPSSILKKMVLQLGYVDYDDNW